MREPEISPLIPPASASGTRRGGGCPDDAQLADWVDGGLLPEVRERLVNHLADCDFCCGQVGFLSRARGMGPPPEVPLHLLAAAKAGRSWGPGWLSGWLRPIPVAAAAAVAAGLLLAMLVASPWGRSWPLPVGSEGDRVVRTVRGPAGAPLIVRPVEGESLSRGALELKWEEAPGALFYTVQLVDAKGDVAWEGRSDGTHLAVPSGAALAPGQSYFAWVIAHLRSGTIVRSPAVGFRLAPG